MFGLIKLTIVAGLSAISVSASTYGIVRLRAHPSALYWGAAWIAAGITSVFIAYEAQPGHCLAFENLVVPPLRRCFCVVLLPVPNIEPSVLPGLFSSSPRANALCWACWALRLLVGLAASPTL